MNKTKKASGKLGHEPFELSKAFARQPVTGAWSVNFPLHDPSLFEDFEMLADRGLSKRELLHNIAAETRIYTGQKLNNLDTCRMGKRLAEDGKLLALLASRG